MKLLSQKEFWFGVGAAFLIFKFGDKLPVAGPYVAKLKA